MQDASRLLGWVVPRGATPRFGDDYERVRLTLLGDPRPPGREVHGRALTDVWVRRTGASTGTIVSVPLPSMRHRFGDVIRFERPARSMSGGGTGAATAYQTARLESSHIGTWRLRVLGARGRDLDRLGDLALARDLGADDWTRRLEAPGEATPPGPVLHALGRPLRYRVVLGLAGPEAEITRLVADFGEACSHTTSLDLEELHVSYAS